MRWIDLILLYLCIILIFIFTGCSSDIATNNVSISNDPSPMASPEFIWLEIEGRFSTNDKTRAQAEIPFPLVYPKYFPNYHNENELSHIKIEGPLRNSNPDDRIDVLIQYWGLPIGNGMSYIILIDEHNSSFSLGEPELNTDLEYIEFQGIQIIKQKNDKLSDYFSFNHNGIYYVIQTVNLNITDSVKIVESMVEQVIKQQ